jgi:hypothetical protein
MSIQILANTNTLVQQTTTTQQATTSRNPKLIILYEHGLGSRSMSCLKGVNKNITILDSSMLKCTPASLFEDCDVLLIDMRDDRLKTFYTEHMKANVLANNIQAVYKYKKGTH